MARWHLRSNLAELRDASGPSASKYWTSSTTRWSRSPMIMRSHSDPACFTMVSMQRTDGVDDRRRVVLDAVFAISVRAHASISCPDVPHARATWTTKERRRRVCTHPGRHMLSVSVETRRSRFPTTSTPVTDARAMYSVGERTWEGRRQWTVP